MAAAILFKSHRKIGLISLRRFTLSVHCVALLCVAAATGAATGAPTSQPLVDPKSPAGALLAELDSSARGDLVAVATKLYPETAEQKTMIPAFAQLAVAKAHFSLTMTSRFGAAASGKYGVDLDSQRAEVFRSRCTIKRDKAEIELGNGNDLKRFVLVKTHDQWLVPVSFVTDVNIENAAPHEMGGRIVAMAEALSEIAQQVEHGDFKSADQAAQAASVAVDQAARGANAQ